MNLLIAFFLLSTSSFFLLKLLREQNLFDKARGIVFQALIVFHALLTPRLLLLASCLVCIVHALTPFFVEL
jgi:hypothetical protein